MHRTSVKYFIFVKKILNDPKKVLNLLSKSVTKSFYSVFQENPDSHRVRILLGPTAFSKIFLRLQIEIETVFEDSVEQ